MYLALSLLKVPENGQRKIHQVNFTNSMASHRCTYIKAIHGFQAVGTAAQDRLASSALRTVGPNDKNPPKIRFVNSREIV